MRKVLMTVKIYFNSEYQCLVYSLQKDAPI
jgi:hypothetical protein